MPGERFTVVIDYDPVVYSKGVVHALFERRESDGFSVCLKRATTYETKEGGDSVYHAVRACKRKLAPVLLSSSSQGKQVKQVKQALLGFSKLVDSREDFLRPPGADAEKDPERNVITDSPALDLTNGLSHESHFLSSMQVANLLISS